MAYASVASLMRTMGSILALESTMGSLIGEHREEFGAFHEKVSFLEVFLNNFEKNNNSGEMTDMEAQIKELATVVEHTIQLKLTQLFFFKNDEMQKETICESLYDSLKHVAEEFDNVQKESPKFQDKGKHALKESLVQDSSSGTHTPGMVGRDDQRKRMLAELTRYGGSFGELKVIPIVGMGGIGKTTLAKEVYSDASVQSHFDVRAWATISQQHNVKEILLSLLRSTKGDKFYMDDEAVLADMLQKSLKGKRYFIVLDDMWKSEAWDDLRLCFPSENNGSRILLTTRNTEVACSAGTENLSMQMSLMDLDESWNLFESIAFANEALPSEFETIGKQIVDKCHRLPLTIVTVAGLLKSKRTIEYWENVTKDVKSFLTNDPDEQCLHVLGLSYNHLTSDLKACLLYFGIFKEDSEVSAKRLVRLWIAEGFLKFEKDLEGVAEKCLQDLVDRCLVLISNRSLDGTRIRYCKVHDLIYELCLREAQKQKLLGMNDIVPVDYNLDEDDDWDEYEYLDEDEDDFVDEDSDDDEDGKEDLAAEDEDDKMLFKKKFRRFKHIMGPSKRQIEEGKSRFDHYRALLIPGHKSDAAANNLLKRTGFIFLSNSYSNTFSLQSKLFHFSLLRILDLSLVHLFQFPPQILCLIWLRYLQLCGLFEIPTDICRLWNLQTFIVSGRRRVNIFPKEIWEQMQLRLLERDVFTLPNPPRVSVDEQRYSGFPNIHTISGLCHGGCTKEVISGIRNVRKLKVKGDSDDYESFQESTLFNNLIDLHQLETLIVTISESDVLQADKPVTIPSAKAFPATLKKLKLHNTGLSWDDLNIIGELPNLEVLKLIFDAVGEEWCPTAGRFSRLKILMIEKSGLKYWKITSDDFPVLERLIIIECFELEEIPIEFAETNSLQLIELEECSPKLEDSATRIQQEQEDLGNKPVDVRISPYNYFRYFESDTDYSDEDDDVV